MEFYSKWVQKNWVFYYVLVPGGYGNDLQNARWYNWEVNDAEKPAKDPISLVSETIWGPVVA